MVSHKGKTFSQEDLPRHLRVKWSEEKKDEWVKDQNQRYKIVALDTSAPQARQAIIAEELDQRILNKLSSKARRIAGAMMLADQAVRLEVLQAFDKRGNLINPFKVV